MQNYPSLRILAKDLNMLLDMEICLEYLLLQNVPEERAASK